MQYLITQPNEVPFLSKWFSIENNYVAGMIVYDLLNFTYYDGTDLKEINYDHL